MAGLETQARILLAHGSGGSLSHRLVEELFLPAFRNPALQLMEDSGPFMGGGHHLVATTDSYVVDPPFFAGGDIGRLAICGTVNDLAVSGARPLCLTAGFILEEGLELELLRRVLESMRAAAAEAGVAIVAGDTKVVPRGKADRIFINTAGVGLVETAEPPGAARIQAGDAVLINGPIGDHGMAVMAAREGLALGGDLRSDCAPLFGLIDAVRAAGITLHAMRDPTRGGLATTLNELAAAAGVLIEIEEPLVPVRESVQAACEILGLDPLYVANEGKVVCFVPGGQAEAALSAMRRHPHGREAARIGQVRSAPRPLVKLNTGIGGARILDLLSGEQLPRIC